MIRDDQQMNREVIGGYLVEATRLRQDDLSSVDCPVIEKDLKLVCQESAMVVRFLPPHSRALSDLQRMTLLLGTPRNTPLG